jgi:TnpA family transposase
VHLLTFVDEPLYRRRILTQLNETLEPKELMTDTAGYSERDERPI